LGFLWAVITFKHLRQKLKNRKRKTPYSDPLSIYPKAVEIVGEKPRAFVIDYDEEGGGLAYKIIFGKEPKQGRPKKEKQEEEKAD
jgi:hypothetical protein